MKYRVLPAWQQPFVLSVDDKPATATAAGFTIAMRDEPSPRRFVVFNLWESSAPSNELESLRPCIGRLQTLADGMASLQRAVTEAEPDVEIRTNEVAKTQKEIAGLIDDAKLFQGIGSDRAAQEVAAIAQKLTAARTRLTTEETALRTATTRLTNARQALAEATARSGGSPAELLGRKDRLSEYIAAKSGQPDYVEALVLKIGGLLLGGDAKAVTYDLYDRNVSDAITIAPMGAYPVVRYGEHLFAMLVNVVETKFPGPFTLLATAQAAAVINIAPARPVFEPGKVKAGEASDVRPSTVTMADTFYRDVVLPIVGTFAPNDLAEVTIETQRPGTDGKPTKVTLVEKAKFPPYRALYRFNVNAGVLRSSLRPKTFQKVKTANDNPETEKVNEARYRVVESEGEPRVMPMFAVSVSFLGVDIQSPPDWKERAIPAVTLGFAFTNPANDVFVGLSHEIVRNLQLFYGLHFGIVNELLLRNDVSEDEDATAPVTREKRGRAFAFGLTFNTNVVSKIFK